MKADLMLLVLFWQGNIPKYTGELQPVEKFEHSQMHPFLYPSCDLTAAQNNLCCLSVVRL